jgi:hypothetical protein
MRSQVVQGCDFQLMTWSSMQLCVLSTIEESIYISKTSFYIQKIKALKYFNGQQHLNRRHGKWAAYLQKFSFTLKNKLGAQNKVANALSRKSLYQPCRFRWLCWIASKIYIQLISILKTDLRGGFQWQK